jgi:hypothetical protein
LGPRQIEQRVEEWFDRALVHFLDAAVSLSRTAKISSASLTLPGLSWR